ncbi:hypothetical protein INT46_009722 [Mucor plumbeus]|uniref:Uncharacterized protein n=1 Tax=Mucor plumbeus TaxID=97098 RepID=A0A8H7R7C2_9FUNG|nr:hypothetical protein INT46_009722 [Mucor plumbeus]
MNYQHHHAHYTMYPPLLNQHSIAGTHSLNYTPSLHHPHYHSAPPFQHSHYHLPTQWILQQPTYVTKRSSSLSINPTFHKRKKFTRTNTVNKSPLKTSKAPFSIVKSMKSTINW